MLIQPGRWIAVAGRGLGQGDGVTDGRDRRAWSANDDHRVESDLLREGHPGVEGVDGTARHAGHVEGDEVDRLGGDGGEVGGGAVEGRVGATPAWE